jgi:hypothetical protein
MAKRLHLSGANKDFLATSAQPRHIFRSAHLRTNLESMNFTHLFAFDRSPG